MYEVGLRLSLGCSVFYLSMLQSQALYLSVVHNPTQTECSMVYAKSFLLVIETVFLAENSLTILGKMQVLCVLEVRP